MAKTTRAPENRQPLTIRLAAAGRSWLDDMATSEGATITTVVRACFAVARRHQSETKELIKEMQG